MSLTNDNYEATTESVNDTGAWGGGGWGQLPDGYRIGYLAIACLGILANLFVVIVIVCHGVMLKRLANYFIFNQSILDMSVGVLLLVTHAAYLAVDGTYDFTGPGADALCRLWDSEMFLWITFVWSTYNMLAMTIERYLCIVHPLYHKSNFTKRHALCLIAVVYFIGPFYMLLLGIPTSEAQDGYCVVMGKWPSEAVQQAAAIIHVFVLFFIPLMAMTYLYGHMIYAINKMAKVRPTGNPAIAAAASNAKDTKGGGGNSRSNRMNRAQRNLMKTVTLVTVSFIVCWSWNQFFFMLSNSGYTMDFNSDFYHFSVFMVYLNCAANPLIYIFKYKEFQDAVQKIVCRKTSGSNDNSSLQSGITQQSVTNSKY